MNDDIKKLAFESARTALSMGEIPVGAVVFDTQTGKVLSSAYNQTKKNSDATGHAEILAIREAGKVSGSDNLSGCSIYSTLEPCPMCAGAIAWAKLDKVYFGAYDEKSGAVDNGIHLFNQASCHHQPEVIGGIGEEEAQKMVSDFFKGLRKNG